MDFDLTTFDNIDNNFEDFHSQQSELNRNQDFNILENSSLLYDDNIFPTEPSGLELTLPLTDDLVMDFDTWYIANHGTPVEDSLVWHQQTTNFTCGIVSAEMIMDMFGLDISESQLVYEATAKGLLSDNGMSLNGIQEILQDHGINTQLGTGDIDSLINELDQGHKIVIPLDSGEIWGEDSSWEDWKGERADHAVVLTGINMDSSIPTVTLNDPGHPEGQAMTIDLDKFIDAWNDSGNQFISTQIAP